MVTTIREAGVEDFLDIAALDRRAWGKNRNSNFIPDGEHAWRLWVEHAQVFCCFSPELVGAILAFPCKNGMYCVHKVIVEERSRGSGIGSALFETLLAVIDKDNLVSFLTVDPENVNAIKLYEKWGYNERVFVNGYYRSNEDRLVLTRRR